MAEQNDGAIIDQNLDTKTGNNPDKTGNGDKTGDQQQQQQDTNRQVAKKFEYAEDRSKWIPPHRLNEVSTKATQFEGQLAEANRRIKALAGLEHKSPEDLEVDEVKAHFAKLYPGLAKLTDQQIEKLLAVAENGDRLAETTNNYWKNHGNQMINKAGEAIAEQLGGGDLSERQLRRIARDYIAFIGSSQDILDRHEAGDSKMIDEFVKDFLEDWQGPIRRSLTASETARRPVPSGKGRNVGMGQKAKIDHNNQKSVEDAMVESYLSHGGTFGN